MSCASAEALLEAYHDHELDSAQQAELTAHLADCASCRAALERLSQLSAAVHKPEFHFQPPAYLESRVRGALRQTSAPATIRVRHDFRTWLALAAVLVLAVAVAWSVLGIRSRLSNPQIIAREVVSSHVRSLLGTHLVDVPSTDRHTVKPWFDGKLDFSPDVKDLANQGFRLIGGRLDYLDGRPVAALVFQRRLHMINLFVWPSSQGPGQPSPDPAQKGYNLVHWNTGGMTYWAVADIPVGELEQFGETYIRAE
jgi:anti-sigma factor RsiW